MVDALREADRVLTCPGVLIDLQPVTEPLVVEVVVAAESVWARTVECYSAPADVAAAAAALQRAVSREWIRFQSSRRFDFEIDCDSADELRAYLSERKLVGAQIPYDELEERRSESNAAGRAARLRCRRPWMLSVYGKE